MGQSVICSNAGCNNYFEVPRSGGSKICPECRAKARSSESSELTITNRGNGGEIGGFSSSGSVMLGQAILNQQAPRGGRILEEKITLGEGKLVVERKYGYEESVKSTALGAVREFFGGGHQK